MMAWKKILIHSSFLFSFFFSSWAQRWDQKSGRSLSTALQASNQRKDFMEVSEVGGGRGWHAGGCIASAAGEKPLDYLTFTSAADCSVHNFQWEILGGWELLLGARRNRGLVASTHLCICILKKKGCKTPGLCIPLLGHSAAVEFPSVEAGCEQGLGFIVLDPLCLDSHGSSHAPSAPPRTG